jgi:hypothetical protein
MLGQLPKLIWSWFLTLVLSPKSLPKVRVSLESVSLNTSMVGFSSSSPILLGMVFALDPYIGLNIMDNFASSMS